MNSGFQTVSLPETQCDSISLRMTLHGQTVREMRKPKHIKTSKRRMGEFAPSVDASRADFVDAVVARLKAKDAAHPVR